MIKLRLLEAIKYEKYADVLTQEFFDWFLEIDPTKDKKYAQWIIFWFMKKFKKYIDGSIERYKKALEFIYKNKVQKPNEEELNNLEYPLDFKKINYIRKNVLLQNPQLNEELRLFLWEDYSKITEDLKKYDLLKNKNVLPVEQKNIMNIKGFQDLWELVDSYEEQLNALEMEALGKDDYEKLYEDKEWLVVIPKTEEASCKYGANTRWCTAGKENNYFKYYTQERYPNSELIIIIQKGVTKWQLHFASNQWKDIKDYEIEDREEFRKSLPEKVKEAIYHRSGNILFLKNYAKYLYTIATNKEKCLDVMSVVGGDDLMGAWQSDPSDERSNYPFSKELLEHGLTYYVSENASFDDYSYDYGYQHPEDYITEEPENKPESEECPYCEGAGYAFPNSLPTHVYKSIENGENEFTNSKLNPEEQKRFLSYYEPTMRNGQIYNYELTGEDEELNQKLQHKCKSCNGTGKERLELDAEWYSEEQREQAGEDAMYQAQENNIRESLGNFSSFRSAEREYGSSGLEDILDKVLEAYKDNTEKYQNDFAMMVDGILQTDEDINNPSQKFYDKVSMYVKEEVEQEI